MSTLFRNVADRISDAAGSPWAFLFAIVLTVVWLVTGPAFHFSDTWQLVMNSITNIVTFLIVFLIQNTQNRDSRATQIKLDELIRAVKGARNSMVSIEDLSDEELRRLKEQFDRLQQTERNRGDTSAAAAAASITPPAIR